MIDSLRAFLPSAGNLLCFAVLIGVVGSFVGLASLIDRARSSAGILLVSGWSCVIVAATLFGVLAAWPLAWVIYPLLAAGLLGAVAGARARREVWLEAGRAVTIAIPVLIVMAAASASQWDEFAHWLINQRYLVEVGTFPRQGLPANVTMFAGYPYGLPLVGFVVSAIAGAMVENAGALLNTLLIVALALVLVEAFRRGAVWPEGPAGWGALAVGFFAATLLNPTFVPKIVFTSYADWPTAVVLGVAVFMAWRTIEAEATGSAADGRPFALHLGLAIALLVTLKQPNVILALLLLGGLTTAALFAPRSSWVPLLRLTPWIVGPALVVYFAWRFHVLHHMPGREFRFLPFADWLWSDMGAILGRMLLIASKKGGYFGLMLVAVGTATYGVCMATRRREVLPPMLLRLAILTATLFLGYNAFLYVAYIGAFGAGEGHNAASYWRYNTQLGGAALVFAAVGMGALYRRFGGADRLSRPAAAGLLAAVLAVSLAFAPKLRFDLNPVTRYVRSVGLDIGRIVPVGSLVVIVDPNDAGKRTLLIRYEARHVAVERVSGGSFSSVAALNEALTPYSGRENTFLWVHEPRPVIAQALGVELAPLSSYLLSRGAEGWRAIRSWPYPGYTSPADEDD